MCQNANKTAASLMQAIEPTLVSLLNATALGNTPDGEAAINAYNAALQAIQNWVPGSAIQNIIQIIGDFQTVFNTLPLPASVQTLTNLILAGVQAVLGVIEANSPAPAAPASATASAEESTHAYQAYVVAKTTANVQALVPGFKRSMFHSAEHQYKQAWNKQVAVLAAEGFPNAEKLKV